MAKEQGLIIALTDHNTVSGLPDFLEEAEKCGVIAVGGTELSCNYDEREFHLLGLFISPEHYESVEALVSKFYILKQKSVVDLVERLNAAGYKVDYASAYKRTLNGNVNRAHIAAELLEGGYVSSVTEAFETVLSKEYGLYVQPDRLELIDAIRFLRSINALPILAHPLKEISADQLCEMLPALIEAGLLGIETMHSAYSDEDIAISKEIASRYSLLQSGGSDYHGSAKPDVSLGTGKGNLNVPSSVYYDLLRLL
jgi:predicted metal-dependent phosphoesterase TrpH